MSFGHILFSVYQNQSYGGGGEKTEQVALAPSHN